MTDAIKEITSLTNQFPEIASLTIIDWSHLQIIVNRTGDLFETIDFQGDHHYTYNRGKATDVVVELMEWCEMNLAQRVGY